jgi:hypothetical protein
MAINTTGYLPVLPIAPTKVITASGATASTSWLDLGTSGKYYVSVAIKVESLGGTNPTHSFVVQCADNGSGANAVDLIPATPTSGNIACYLFNCLIDDNKQFVKIAVTLGGTSPTISYSYDIRAYRLA